jgi:sulfate adenylyltransferase subunit 1 (EFTu-like GTPase family)
MSHRWASTSISVLAVSDIDICYSDIEDKYVGLKNVIPISTSEFIPISDIEEKNIFLPTD